MSIENANTPITLTSENYETKYKPIVDQVVDIINTSEDLPEDFNLAEVLSGVITIRDAIPSLIESNTKEIIELKSRLEKKEQALRTSQTACAQMMAERGKYSEPAPDPNEKPKLLTWQEIEQKIKNL